MPLRLDVRRGYTARSDRVKCVDQHPTEPWMMVALYNGHINVWSLDSNSMIKSFEVCDLPVRAAKFVARKNWVVSGSDDMQVRVFNYNTLEKSHQFEAHSDYIRSIAVHPTQPYILTSSDDMLIKLWNWDQKWACQQVFEGHTHYVMQIVINPKDNNTFASASLDRTVKVWQLGSPQANFTLEGHMRGVNCVDYSHGGDKPYLISGADDSLLKIWDYQNKTCVQTLEGHSQNVSAVQYHPSLPIILSGSEDCTVKIWHANTYRLQNNLNYGLDRLWCIGVQKTTNNIVMGYDEGAVFVKLGREDPAISMDISGKMVFARHAEMQQANLKATADATSDIQDGERLPLAVKDGGSCDIYPQNIQHNPNGRFVVVCGDGEYIIYTAMALRNKAFGPALEFAWGLDSSEYAIRETNYTIKLFKNFKEKTSFKPEFGCESMFGGQLLGCGTAAAGLLFYEWETQELVRRIDTQAKQVFWSDNGCYVAIATETNFFVLRYNAEVVVKAREAKEELPSDGIEEAFELLDDMPESVRTGKWVGDCFIYTNSVNRLNYYVGGEIVTIAHLDRTLYLLGYIAKDNRVYLADKELSVVSYELHLSVLDYQTAVMRTDFDTADRVLKSVPISHRTRVAQFLEKQGFKEQALQVTQDPDHKFNIALSLGNLATCVSLAEELDSEQKWIICGDLAQQQNDLNTSKKCLLHAKDHAGLLLQATSAGDGKLIREVGDLAIKEGRNNVGFLSLFIGGQLKECLQLLIDTKRIPEAAFFARSYLPSETPRVLKLWREAAGETIGPSLADPKTYDNLFPGMMDSLKAEYYLAKTERPTMATLYPTITPNVDRNVLQEVMEAEQEGRISFDEAQLGFMSEDEEENEGEDRENEEEFNDAFDSPQKLAAVPPQVKPEVPAPAERVQQPLLDLENDDFLQPPLRATPPNNAQEENDVDLEEIERELELDMQRAQIERMNLDDNLEDSDMVTGLDEELLDD